MNTLISMTLISIGIFTTMTAEALPNPAAVHCTDNKFSYVLIQETGFCIFPDHSYCEEWAYFRGQCIPGHNTLPGGARNAKKPGQYCLDQKDPTHIAMCK